MGGGSSPPIPTTSFAGTNPRCTNILVDGVQQKDNFGLNASGTTSTRDAIPLEWAASVQVALTPYDVQYNDTCGGVVNVVTKSGQQRIPRHRLWLLQGRQSLNGKDLALWTPTTGKTDVTGDKFQRQSDADEAPFLSRKRYGGTLSGAIIEDTLFFFVGYDELKRTTQPSALNAVDPWPARAIPASSAEHLAGPGQPDHRRRPEHLWLRCEATWPTISTEYNQRYIAKLTWQINDDHALTASYQHVARRPAYRHQQRLVQRLDAAHQPAIQLV